MTAEKRPADPSSTQSAKRQECDSHRQNGDDKRFTLELSKSVQNLARNPIRATMLKFQETPGCMMLAGGRPVFSTFPGPAQELSDEFANYGPHLAAGHKDLLSWARSMIDTFHGSPGMWENRDVTATSGNTDGITKCISLLTDQGDTILADEFTYPGIMASAMPYGRRIEAVGMDEGGMNPDSLVAAIDRAKAAGSRVRLLYLTPHGQNPTGISLSVDRKTALYSLARQHELVIIEDDPYYFLNFLGLDLKGDLQAESMPGRNRLPASLLSMDVDGRVVRLDTVSKFIAPGYRLGWATGPKVLIERWRIFSEVTTWGLSGVLQKSFLALAASWTPNSEELHAHLQTLQSVYAERCKHVLGAMDKHLTGLCKWAPPDGGMFIWLKVLGIDDTEAIADELISTYGVALVPGAAFTPSAARGETTKSCYFRVSFTQMDGAKADEAMRRLATGLRALAKA